VPEAEIKKLQRIYTAIQQGDWEEMARSLAHDVEWTLPETLPWGGTHHGHLGVQAITEAFDERYDGLWADPDEFIDDGDSIVVLGRIMGQAHATGTEFEVEFAHVWRMTDGVPSSFRGYFDTAPIMAALEGKSPSEGDADGE